MTAPTPPVPTCEVSLWIEFSPLLYTAGFLLLIFIAYEVFVESRFYLGYRAGWRAGQQITEEKAEARAQFLLSIELEKILAEREEQK